MSCDGCPASTPRTALTTSAVVRRVDDAASDGGMRATRPRHVPQGGLWLSDTLENMGSAGKTQRYRHRWDQRCRPVPGVCNGYGSAMQHCICLLPPRRRPPERYPCHTVAEKLHPDGAPKTGWPSSAAYQLPLGCSRDRLPGGIVPRSATPQRAHSCWAVRAWRAAVQAHHSCLPLARTSSAFGRELEPNLAGSHCIDPVGSQN